MSALHQTTESPRDPAILASVDEALLMRRIADGDDRAFEELYDRFSARVLAMLRNLCRDEELAHDLLQDVFVLIWRKAATYHPSRGNVAGWIYAITRNRAVDQQRRARPAFQLLPEESHDPPDTLHPAHRCELRITLEQAMDQLKTNERDCVRLAYFSGLTYRETADRLAIPLGTLKSRIRAALGRMRRQLASA